MTEGHVVYRTTDTGSAKYRTSRDGQGRIEWAFTHDPCMTDWDNAYIFVGDFDCTAWEVW